MASPEYLSNSGFTRAIANTPDGDPRKRWFWEDAPDALATRTQTLHRSIATPRFVLVNKDYPGIRYLAMNGPEAEEAISKLIAASISNPSDVDLLKTPLQDGALVRAIIKRLYPRPGQRVMRGKAYQLSSPYVYEAVFAALEERKYELPEPYRFAFAYQFQRVLAHLELCLPDLDLVVPFSKTSMIATKDDIIQGMLATQARSLFSEKRYADFARSLDRETTPEVLGEELAAMMQRISIPFGNMRSIVTKVELALALVQMYCVTPDMLPDHIREMTALTDLANIANLVDESFTLAPFALPQSTFAMAEAVNAVQVMITQIADVDYVSREAYVKLYGVVPSEFKRRFKGAVIWRYVDTVPAFRMVERVADDSRIHLYPVSQSLDSSAVYESMFKKNVTSKEALRSLVSIVADEIATIPATDITTPVLRAIGVEEREMRILAYLLASSVYVGVSEDGSPRKPIFGVAVSERWLFSGKASTTDYEMFDNPVAAVLYSLGDRAASQEIIPSEGGFSKPAKPVGDKDFLVPSYVDLNLSDRPLGTFGITIETELRSNDSDEDLATLRISVPLLPNLLPPPDRTGRIDIKKSMHFRYLQDREMDNWIAAWMRVASHMAYAPHPTVRNSGQSWLLTSIGAACSESYVLQLANSVLRNALLDLGANALDYRARYRRLQVRVMLVIALGALAKYEKMSADDAAMALSAIPTSTLTTQAITKLSGLVTFVGGEEALRS